MAIKIRKGIPDCRISSSNTKVIENISIEIKPSHEAPFALFAELLACQ